MPSKKVDVSVIIRAYNSDKTIAKAVESALLQTLPKKYYEILVVDDGSNDETLSILKRYRGKVRLIKQPHLGAKVAVRTGINKSRGTYIIFLDSDDEFKPEILKKMVDVIKKDKQIDLVYCDYFEKIGKIIKKVSLKENIFNSIWTNLCFKKSLLNQVPLAPDYIFFGEYDFIIRLQKYKKKLVYISEPLYVYYRSKGSITSDKKSVEQGVEQLRKRYGNIVNKIRAY